MTLRVSVCSTLIANPTYTPKSQLPSDYTWGCPPGFLCWPSRTGGRKGCNVETGLPAEGYVCNPSDCILAPPLVLNQSWALDAEGHHYNFSRGYYNLNPEDFGLRYDIFETAREHNATQSKRSILSFGSDPRLFEMPIEKRDLSDIPGVCYNDCNDAALEQQATGKKPSLCESDSVYLLDIENCKTCISHHADSPSDAFSSSLLPSFAQFLNYCSDLTTTSTSITSQTSATQSRATATTSEEESKTSTQPGSSSNRTGTAAASPTGTTTSTTTTNGMTTISETDTATEYASTSQLADSSTTIGSAKIVVSITIPSSITITGPTTIFGFETIESTTPIDSTTQPSSLGQGNTKSISTNTESKTTTIETTNGSQSISATTNTTGDSRHLPTEASETPSLTGGEESPTTTISFNLGVQTLQPPLELLLMLFLTSLALLT